MDAANNEGVALSDGDAADLAGNERTRPRSRSRRRRKRRRRRRESGGGGGANCRNKNVWIENFVYSPEFSVKWRFGQSDLQQINQTNMVISFR